MTLNLTAKGAWLLLFSWNILPRTPEDLTVIKRRDGHVMSELICVIIVQPSKCKNISSFKSNPDAFYEQAVGFLETNQSPVRRI
jgi:hypothetical protein